MCKRKFLIGLLCVAVIGVSISMAVITAGNELASAERDVGQEENGVLAGLPPNAIVEIGARVSAVETMTIAATITEEAMAICHEEQEMLAAVDYDEAPPPQNVQVTTSHESDGVELWAIGRAAPGDWSNGLLRRTAMTEATFT